MKVYSLYLSSLTGATQQAVFTATVATNVLTITAIISGTVLPLQYVNINGQVNQIVAWNSGTYGAVGAYTLFNTVGTVSSNNYVAYNFNNNKIIPQTASNTASIVAGGITFTATNTATAIQLQSVPSSNISSGMSFYLNGTIATITSLQSGTANTVGAVYAISPNNVANAATQTLTTLPYLNVSAAGVATVAVGQYVETAQTVNLATNTIQIIGLGTGTGGTGTYALNNGTTTASGTVYYYTTQYVPAVGKYAPTNLNVGVSISNLRYSINWKEIFGNRNGECRCRVRYISNSGSNITWITNIGSVRASFQSTSSNSTNLCNLGCVRPQNDFTGTGFTYLDCDTTTSNGATVIIPNTNQDFQVSLFNANESLMSNVPDYQVWFYFHCDDEDPTNSNDIGFTKSGNVVQAIYNPR